MDPSRFFGDSVSFDLLAELCQQGIRIQQFVV